MLKKINEKDFIETYENAYFKGNPKPNGISRLNQTSCKIEIYIESLLNKPEKYTYRELLEIVSWKAGNLKDLEQPIKYYNGYGKSIDKNQLEKYLILINQKADDIRNKAKNPDNATLLDIYQNMLPEVPKYFGSVYILNLLYFITKGQLPIYDKFAHKALIALSTGVSPGEVTVKPAPAKDSKKSVIKMYTEYIHLLESLFGQKDISRSLDRALWVYGHSKIAYTK